jgi:predicted phage tail protein
MWMSIIVALVMSVVSYLLTPKPKPNKPAAAQDLENPTAEAGRPVPVVFGTITVKSSNVLWFGEKSVSEYEVKA